MSGPILREPGDAPPGGPCIRTLVETEIHLVVHCDRCHREARLTPTEAAHRLGEDCTFIQARDRLRCSWCGARGQRYITARPCGLDAAARQWVEDCERMLRLWPGSAFYERQLAEARRAWDARRPEDSIHGMCNAFRLKTPISTLVREFEDLGLPLQFDGGVPNDWPEIEMTRPTNTLPVFKPLDASEPAKGLAMANKRWWLVPFFHRGETKAWKAMCTNARAETVATSRTFKGPFERRRCLVPADGYYEWTGEPGSKTRWLFERPDAQWWAFAGVWDRAETAEGVVESFAILTTEAGADSRHIHNRQPVILDQAQMGRWLDLSADVTDLMRPSPEGTLRVAQT